MRIFISHHSADAKFVASVSNQLKEHGYEVFHLASSKLNARKSVLKMLNEQMQRSDVLMLVWSENSFGSNAAMSEMRAAMMLAHTDQSKRLFPIMLDDAKPPIELAGYVHLRVAADRPSIRAILRALEEYDNADQSIESIQDDRSQRPNIAALREAHELGNLTLVCGAGISIGAKIPPWSKLLDRLLDAMLRRLIGPKSDLEAVRSEITDIRSGSSLIAGRYLKNVLKDDFQEEVRLALYEGSEQTCETIDAIVELARPKRGKKPLDSIISFNFDDLLERNFRTSSIEHKAIFSEGSRTSPTELPIYHVHGYLPMTGRLQKSNQLVFSEDSYHDQFVDPFSWSNLTQLNKFSQNTCLFVGLSMTDPNLRRLLDVAMRREGSGSKRHFAILKRSPNSSKSRLMESLQEQDAASLGITILWIEEFDDIPGLIRELC